MHLDMKSDTRGRRLACISLFALAFSVTPANADVVTAPVNLGFTAVDPCTVTGSTIDLGTYVGNQLLSAVRARNGSVTSNGQITPGSQAPVELGTVRCSVNTMWSAAIVGQQSRFTAPIGFFDMVNTSQGGNGTDSLFFRFPVVPVVYSVDGVAIAGGRLIQIEGDPARSVQAVGTGLPQPILGTLAVLDDGNNPFLKPGPYRNASTRLIVNFSPVP